MFKNIYKIPLIILFITLMGCASTPPVPVYNNSSNHYIQAMDLPADYPTKYLPDGNMWNDFKKNLQLPVDTSNPYIKAQIRWYQNHQSFLNNSIQRGAPFLFYAFQQTKKYNLPAELALIPIGESGFIPSNKSNRGAVGLWQFMPSTAAEFNLKINRYYNGLRDPIASTDAALKYFTYLHYYFDNDWLLAIAAYNTGPGNVQKAQFRNQRQNLPTKDFWALHLHPQTREYIPKLLALSAIIKNPKKYGVYLTPVNDSLYFEQVDVGHQINLNNVAKLSDSKPSTIKLLNPALLQGVTPPAGPYVVLVPKSKSSLFKKRIGSSNDSVSNSEEPKETTQAIPAVTTSAVQTQTAAETQISQENVSENQNKKGTTETTKKYETQTKPAPSFIKYKVKKKETLRKIAKKYNTSKATLRKINKLKSNSIRMGQLLLVPNPNKTESTTSTTNDEIIPEKTNSTANTEQPSSAKTEMSPQANTKPTIPTAKEDDTNAEIPAPVTKSKKQNNGIKTFNYKVTATDTIYSISRKFNTSPITIQKLNQLKDNKIKPGQNLKIQGNSATIASHNKAANKKAAHKTANNSANKKQHKH